MMWAFYLGAIGLLTAAASVARAECDELQNLSLPLAGDTALELSSAALDCTILEDGTLEEFIIEGGTLTLTGSSTTKFTNLRFTVMDGAGLIFDFATTEFGPNLGFEQEDNYGGFMVQVMSGGSVDFTGKMAATGLDNMRSVFWNEAGGSIEFSSDAVFNECNTNVFRDNFGRLRFYGDATFRGNYFLAISNDGGSVRINGDALFESNGRAFDGHDGGAFANRNGGTAIFRGLATFIDNRCDGAGGGAYNGQGSKMTFYKKASFTDNFCSEGDGGGIDNFGGNLKFRGAMYASGNRAGESGGGVSTGNGGTTTFYGWTTIRGNSARSTGGGMSLYKEGESDGGNVVTFRKQSPPDAVTITLNELRGNDVGCKRVYVEDNSEVIGFDTFDLCDPSS